MRRLGVWCLLAALATSAPAATVTVVNDDGPNEGFNDPTPVAPVGGNPGTTRGAQRLNAFELAAAIWGAQLASSVTIRIGAVMDPLPCNASSATLGQAGPTTVHRDFPGAAVANTWYPQALGNRLAGTDLSPGQPDVSAQFNSAIGTTCAFPLDWYYGLDASPPPGTLDFATVVLHEIGHGLGFLTFVDVETGTRFLGRNDTFMLHLEDHDSGLPWSAMSDAQRASSATDTGDLHWVGGAVVANAGFLAAGLHPSGHVRMYAPNPTESGSSVSHFDTVLAPDQLLEPFYTAALHDLSLTRHLMTDIGWGSASGSSTTTTSFPGVTSTSVSGTTTTTGPTTTTLPGACTAEPTAGCRTSASQRSTLIVRKAAEDRRNVLRWKLGRAGASAPENFKHPTEGAATLRVCLYDASASAQPLTMASILPAATCAGRACWKAIGNPAQPLGYHFRYKGGSADGLTAVKLKVNAAGEAQIVVKGKGPNLPLPPLGLTLPAIIQLVIGDSGGTECWQATFTSAVRNQTNAFKATLP